MWLVLGMMYETILCGVSLFSVVPLPNLETTIITLVIAFLVLKVILAMFPKTSSAKLKRHIFYSLVSFSFLCNYFAQYFWFERTKMNKWYILNFCIIWVVAILYRLNNYWTESLHDKK